MRRLLPILFLICTLICGCEQKSLEEHTKTIFAMDTVMDLKIYSENEDVLFDAEAEIKRIENLLDRGNENSEIYKINNSKIADISDETANLLRNAKLISERTNGAFDISIAPVIDLWGFYGNEFNVPSDDDIKSSLENIGYENIQLDGNKVILPESFSIDVGGIGKGYTSDKISELLKRKGVKSAIISLGGNVQTIGKKNDGSLWTVGIADPKNKSRHIGKLKVSDKAVITSGGYQRYFKQDGIIYHHIIDPNTGMSANSGLASVTIISDSGTLADGLSTSLFVMGLDKSIELWRNSKDFEAVLVDDNGSVYVTEGIADIFECNSYCTIITK